MAWITFDILINCFQSYLFLNFATECFASKTHSKAFDFILWLSIAVFFSLFLFIQLPPIDTIVFLFPIVFSVFFSDENILSILYWHSMFALIFILVANLAGHIYLFLLDTPLISFNTNSWQHVIFISFTNLILFILTKLLILQKSIGGKLKLSTHFPFFLMITSILLCEESLFHYQTSVIINEGSIFFLVAQAGLVFCTILSVFLFHTVSKSSLKESRYQAELSLYTQSKQHHEELTKTYSQLVAYRHDIRHHLQTLEHLVAQGHNRDAQDYLASMKTYSPKQIFITGCSAIDALLSAKYTTMEQNEISFRYAPTPLCELPIDTIDFCSIIGNLLDNAIEGILRIPIDKRRKAEIHLSFLKTGDMFFINCENPCDPSSLIIQRGIFKSSKSQNSSFNIHGIGLSNIDRIACQAEGRASFYCENSTFYAQVVLPYFNHNVKRL